MGGGRWLLEVASTGWTRIHFDPIASLFPLSEDLLFLPSGRRAECGRSGLLHWSTLPAIWTD